MNRWSDVPNQAQALGAPGVSGARYLVHSMGKAKRHGFVEAPGFVVIENGRG